MSRPRVSARWLRLSRTVVTRAPRALCDVKRRDSKAKMGRLSMLEAPGVATGQSGSASGVVDVLVPILRASFGSEVEQVPERLECADVPGLLTRLGRRVEHLRAPEVTDPVAVPVEHGQHRPLYPVRRLGVAVAVVRVRRGGQESQPRPAALSGERQHAGERGLGHDREVDELAGVLGGAVELVDQRGTGRAGPFGERQLGCLPGGRSRALIAGVAREHEAVEHERFLTRGEQLRELDVRRRPDRASAS